MTRKKVEDEDSILLISDSEETEKTEGKANFFIKPEALRDALKRAPTIPWDFLPKEFQHLKKDYVSFLAELSRLVE